MITDALEIWFNKQITSSIPKIIVMMPLDLLRNDGSLQNPQLLTQQLTQVKNGGVDG